MARNQGKVHKGTVFITLLIAGLTLLFLPHNITSNLNLFFSDLFKPFLSIGRVGPAYMFRPGDPSKEYVARREYDRLWVEYKNIQSELEKALEDYQKVAKYRAYMPQSSSGLLPASIITYQPSNYMIIDKGSNEGVGKGMYVLGENTIIGVVSDVGPSTAKINALTQKNYMFEVRIWRDRMPKYIPGNMIGTGKGTCSIGLISREHDVKPGDAVFASPKPGYLDTARIIGEVVSAWPSETDPLLWDITVKPLYQIKDLKDVAVIANNLKGENQ